MPGTSTYPSAVVVSGLCEIAVGALSGFAYAAVREHPAATRRAGVRAPDRVRQWHLDLIQLGGFTAMAGHAVPDLPKRVSVPLAIGGWTNAMAFLPLAFRPDWTQHAAFRGAVATSFTVTCAGWVGVAVTAVARRRRGRR